jgi:Zn finger protein HypA/HybF involved in hydrogenase expression
MSDGSSIKYQPPEADGNEQLETVHIDINELTKKIDRLATSIIGTPIRTRTNPIAKERAEGRCPNCNADLSYKQRPTETSVKAVKCTECSAKLMSKWSVQDGFQLSLKPAHNPSPTPPKILPEDIVDKVSEALPKQPWPKGTSQEVAHRLGISANDMRRAIDTLVSKGVFKVQVDGVLYDPIKKRTVKAKLAKATVTKVEPDTSVTP